MKNISFYAQSIRWRKSFFFFFFDITEDLHIDTETRKKEKKIMILSKIILSGRVVHAYTNIYIPYIFVEYLLVWGFTRLQAKKSKQ